MSRFPLLTLLVCGLAISFSGYSKAPAVMVPPAATKMKIILHGVSSGSDPAAIQPDAARVLDEAARILQYGMPTTVIVAACHNCSPGEQSAATLESVRDYLNKKGAAHALETVQFAKR